MYSIYNSNQTNLVDSYIDTIGPHIFLVNVNGNSNYPKMIWIVTLCFVVIILMLAVLKKVVDVGVMLW